MANNSKEKQKEYDEKRAGERAYNWWFVIYPEDLPENYIEVIRNWHISSLLSPMHDTDPKEDENGNPLKNEIGEIIFKKKHRHLLLMFSSKKYFAFVVQLFKDAFGTTETGAIKGVATPIVTQCRVADKHQAARYLCHLDNPEKTHYDPSDVIAMNGADVLQLLKGGAAEELEMYREVQQYIFDNDIREYCMLCNAFSENTQLYNHIVHHTIHYHYLITSYRNMMKAADENDPK